MAIDQKAIQEIADNLAAETIARAELFKAQGKLRGKVISHIDAINAALLAMLCERGGNGD